MFELTARLVCRMGSAILDSVDTRLRIDPIFRSVMSVGTFPACAFCMC